MRKQRQPAWLNDYFLCFYFQIEVWTVFLWYVLWNTRNNLFLLFTPWMCNIRYISRNRKRCWSISVYFIWNLKLCVISRKFTKKEEVKCVHFTFCMQKEVANSPNIPMRTTQTRGESWYLQNPFSSYFHDFFSAILFTNHLFTLQTPFFLFNYRLCSRVLFLINHKLHSKLLLRLWKIVSNVDLFRRVCKSNSWNFLWSENLAIVHDETTLRLKLLNLSACVRSL